MKLKKIIAAGAVSAMALQSGGVLAAASTMTTIDRDSLLKPGNHTIVAEWSDGSDVKRSENTYSKYDGPSIKIYLNGKEVETDTEPQIIDGTTYVPARAVFEDMGLEVEWNQDSKSIILKGAGVITSMTIGSTELKMRAMYNENDVRMHTLSKAPEIINSRVMIPLRGTAELYGASVDWDPDEKRIDIVYLTGEVISVDSQL